MKKYVKPQLQTEEFVAQEYVAACYKVQCVTPNNNARFYYFYKESGKQAGLQVSGNNKDELLYDASGWGSSGAKGCDLWHNGVIENPVKNGYVVNSKTTNNNMQPNVYIWEEKLGGNTVDVHVSANPESAYSPNPRTSD